MSVPIIAVVGWSGVGKTTFLERLIPEIKKKGIRVGVVKQDGHDFDMDREGKDTWRHTAAGADLVGISNGRHGALLLNRPTRAEDIIAAMDGVDLILTEGCHNYDFPQLEIHRAGFGKLRTERPENLVAVITDEKLAIEAPQLGFDQLQETVLLIMEKVIPDVDCVREYREIEAGERTVKKRVSVYVDGKEIAMVPFVQDMLAEVNLALLNNLKDTNIKPDSKIRIVL